MKQYAKRGIALLLVLALLVGFVPTMPVAAGDSDFIHSTASMADPDILYYNGYYFGTWSAGNRIILARSRTLEDLRDKGEQRVVYDGEAAPAGQVRYAIWAPEIVHDPVGNRWYIYASGSAVNGVSNYQPYHQLFCVESDSTALWGGFHYGATLTDADNNGRKDPSVYYVQEYDATTPPIYDGSEVTRYHGTPYIIYNYQSAIWICKMDSFKSVDISKSVRIKAASESWENGRNCGGGEFFEYDGKLYIAYTAGTGSYNNANDIGLLLFSNGSKDAFRRTALDDASKWKPALSVPLVVEHGSAQPTVFTDNGANLWLAFHDTTVSNRPMRAVRLLDNGQSVISPVSRDTKSVAYHYTPNPNYINDFNGWSIAYNNDNGAAAAKILADGLKTYCNFTPNVSKSAAAAKTIFLDTVNYPANYVRGDVKIDFDAANQRVTLFAAAENAAGLAGYFVSNFLANDNIHFADEDDYYGDLIANPTTPSVFAADPCVRYYNGYYYGMWTRSNSMCLYRSENLSNLSTSSQRKVIYQVPQAELDEMGITDASTWAPEFVQDDETGIWYVYFSRRRYTPNGNKYQLCYLKSSGDDLWNSTFTFEGYLFDWRQEDFCIDPTVLTFKDNNGNRQIYLMYNQKTQYTGSKYVDPISGNQLTVENYLFLVKMKNYGEADFSTRVKMTSGGDYLWENEVDGSHSWLNEGPHFLQIGNRLFCAYSANAYGNVRYLLGFLEFTPGVEAYKANPDSLLNRSNWKKLEDPYLLTGNNINGPGHNSFFVDKYGELWIAYHGRTGSNTGSFRPLCFQRVELDMFGTPMLNVKPEPYQTETKRNTYSTDVRQWVTSNLRGTYVGGNSFTYSADVDVFAMNRTAQIMLGYHISASDGLVWSERAVLQLTGNDANYGNQPWLNLFNVANGWSYVPGGVTQPTKNATVHIAVSYDASRSEISVRTNNTAFTQKISKPIVDFTVGTEKMNAVFHNVEFHIDDPATHFFPTIAPLTDGVYEITAAKDNRFCLALDGNVKLRSNKTTKTTRFAFVRNADDTYLIRCLNNNQYLTVNRDGSWSLFGAALKSGDEQLLQHWVLTEQVDGTFAIVNAATDKSFDVSNNLVEENRAVGTWQYDENIAKRWLLKPVDSIADGNYILRSSDNRVWDSSSNLLLNTYNGNEKQYFSIQYAGNGIYTVFSSSHKTLSHYPQNPPDAPNVLDRVGLYGEDPMTHPNDQWYVLPWEDGTISLVSVRNGSYIGISGNQLQAQPANGEANQRWSIDNHTHSCQLKNQKNATCTEAGYSGDMVCSCGYVQSKGKEIAPLGHNYQQICRTNPTCTQKGKVKYACSRCDSSYENELPIVNHTIVTDKAVAPTCTTYGLTEGSHCEVCGEVFKAQTQVPMLAHQFANGTCSACGISQLQKDENLIFHEATLVLSDSLAINYYIKDSLLSGYEHTYVKFKKAIYDENGSILRFKEETVELYAHKESSRNQMCHVYTLKDVFFHEMSSLVTATIYAEKDGFIYEGQTLDYSVVTYAKYQLQHSLNTDVKTMIVDILYAGTSVQKACHYNLPNLPTNILTEEWKAYRS